MFTLEEVTMQKNLVEKLLNKLKNKDIVRYNVVMLSVFENKKNYEIAIELGISKNMISRHLYQGLKHMRDYAQHSLRIKGISGALH